MRRLKPCPFCGNKWINVAIGFSEPDIYYASCLCNTCGAEGEKFQYKSVGFPDRTMEMAKRLACKRWNQRRLTEMDQKTLRDIAVELMKIEKETGKKKYYTMAEQLITFARATVCKTCNGIQDNCPDCGGDGIIKERLKK